MFLANLRMAYKLGLGFALVTVLTLMLGGISLWQMRQMHSSTEVAVEHAMPSVMNVSNLRTLWNRVRRAEAGILNVHSAAEVDGHAKNIDQLLQEIQATEKAYEALDRSPQEQALMAAYQQKRQDYLQTSADFLKLAREKDYEQPEGNMLLGDSVTIFYAGTAEPIFTDLVKILGELADFGKANAQAAGEAAERSYDFALAAVGLGMAVSTLLAALLGWLTTRAVTVPAGHAVRVARSIAAGDLAQDVPAGGRDEMGMLLQELGHMRSSLERVVSEVRTNAEGVSTGSEQIASGNTDLSSRTEEQASALQQTAASMEQMSATVRHNADSASQANQLALNASNIAVRGGDVVGQVVATMKGIDASSQKIADIIGVIDGIAFQTNILALNAAVEAARAGEQGRGFAVVAGEVRALAGRSAEAAKEIKQLIDESVQRVGQGSQLVSQAGATMDEVVAAIRQVADLVGEITAASKEQSQGVSQVSDAIAQMDQATQQNAAMVEESAAAAASLQRQAADLLQSVSSFKLQGVHSASGMATSLPRAAAVNKPVVSKSSRATALPSHASTRAEKIPATLRQPSVASLPVPSKAQTASSPKVTANDDDWETF